MIVMWRAFGKRCFDIGISGVVLLLLLPLFLLIMAAIRWESRGSCFFCQLRVGRDFVPFRILKFRTMRVDAEAVGGQLTMGDRDPRITRVGSFLRATKLDELPQLWNVLCGEMSLVGPRPEVGKYVELFHDDYADLLTVRPGITDPASIEYRNEGAILAVATDPEQAYLQQVLPNKIRLSKDYVATLSFLGDMRLLAATVVRVVRN